MPLLAYHLTFSAYGHWLPNDPRGSGSRFVGSQDLLPFGPATGLDDRSRSVAGKQHDRAQRLAAKHALQRPAVRFNGMQARAVGRGFGEYVARSGLTVWACAILPDHVHLVTGRFRLRVEALSAQLKNSATRRLREEGLHHFQTEAYPATCWGERLWKVFLNDEAAILRAIRYVEDNPLKEGKPRQQWSFVVPYPAHHQ